MSSQNICRTTPRYVDFTKKVVGLTTSSDAQNVINFAQKPNLDSKGTFTFTLADGVNEFVSSVKGNIMCEYKVTDEKTGNSKHRFLYLGDTYDVGSDDKGTYTDKFDGKWLSLPDGQLLALYADSVLINGKRQDFYQKYLVPIKVRRGSSNEITAMLAIYQSTATKEVSLGGYLNIDDVDNAFGRDMSEETPMEVGDIIKPMYCVLDDDGSDSSWFTGKECAVDKNFGIKYGPMSEGTAYYYQFAISDVYGGVQYTDIAKFSIGNDGKLTYDKELFSL